MSENGHYEVFDTKAIKELTEKHKSVLEKMAAIEMTLNKRFAFMEKPIRALMLSVIAGYPMIFVGPPGTAKSKLIRSFCNEISIETELPPEDVSRPAPRAEGKKQELKKLKKSPDYFEYLMTPFTEPGELFGFFDLEQIIEHNHFVRKTDNMMQEARVVYLDEVFNASGAILNALLAFMNERYYHDQGEVTKVNMECMFAATNQIPRRNELRAVFDRFVIRSWVNNISDGSLDMSTLFNLYNKAWPETLTQREPQKDNNLLPALSNFRDEVNKKFKTFSAKEDRDFFGKMVQNIVVIRKNNYSEMTNRRLVQFMYLMLIHRMYEAVIDGIGKADFKLRDRELALWEFVIDVNPEGLSSRPNGLVPYTLNGK